MAMLVPTLSVSAEQKQFKTQSESNKTTYTPEDLYYKIINEDGEVRAEGILSDALSEVDTGERAPRFVVDMTGFWLDPGEEMCIAPSYSYIGGFYVRANSEIEFTVSYPEKHRSKFSVYEPEWNEDLLGEISFAGYGGSIIYDIEKAGPYGFGFKNTSTGTIHPTYIELSCAQSW